MYHLLAQQINAIYPIGEIILYFVKIVCNYPVIIFMTIEIFVYNYLIKIQIEILNYSIKIKQSKYIDYKIACNFKCIQFSSIA